MVMKQTFLRRLTDGMDLPGESLPGVTTLELIGDCRIIIENHKGVIQYSRELIIASVSYGRIQIRGNGLELMQMTARQLMISGNILSISPVGRTDP